MRSLLFSVSLVICLSLTGQDYKPMVIEGNTWAYAWWSWGWAHTEYQFIEGDTLINDITYKKMYNAADSLLQSNVYLIGFIREDLVNKEVYFTESGDEELLLYKFGLDVGDTVVYSTVWFNICEVEDVVGQVDTIVDATGTPRRRMLLHNWSNEYWIEGVGSNWGPLTPGHYNCIADLGWQTLCMKNNNELIYMNPDQNTCFLHEIGIPDHEMDKDATLVVPNPVTGTSIIQLPDKLKISSLGIYDSFGRLVAAPSVDERIIEKGSLKPGIYFLKIQTVRGEVYNSKFMVK